MGDNNKNYYTKNARVLCEQYNSMSSDDVHRSWRELMPTQPGLACDIGAGSGRDAAWLASKGWDVIAVEPNAELRALGQKHIIENNPHASVSWLDDMLPELKALRSLDQKFQLILISAVWMHMPPAQHERAMRIVSELLAPGGVLVITLRRGPDEAGRFYPVSAEEVIGLARGRALVCKVQARVEDFRKREGVEWDVVVFMSKKV